MKRHMWLKPVLLTGIFVCLFAGSLCYGNTVRQTYVDDTDFDRYLQNRDLRILYYHYPFDKQYDVYGEGNMPADYEALADSADLIVRARLVEGEKRSIYQECILSEIEVLDVYQGKIGENRQLSIFEPVNCTGIEGEMLCSEGYIPMRKDTEYILFLKGLRSALFAEDDLVYIPSTLSYSKYEIGKIKTRKFRLEEAESGKLKYENIKSQEVLLYSEKMYENFIQLKKVISQNIIGNISITKSCVQ